MRTDPLPRPLPEQLPEPAAGTASGLPTARRGARWRWSGRRKALVAGASSATTASGLKVGDFIGVQGTGQSDGAVTASSIVISDTAPPGASGGRVKGGRPPAPAPAA